MQTTSEKSRTRQLAPLSEAQIRQAKEIGEAMKESPEMSLEELRAQTPPYQPVSVLPTPDK